MTAKIQRLDGHLINQIAAGEVIENPASVVKELVENALDADSTEIVVEIQTGGRHLIRVRDNGSGMSTEDAALAFERHATSKISSFSDFETLNTMGFRGEAVPSIASISKCTLITAMRGENGTLLQVDGGEKVRQSAVPRDQGTTVEVKSLFFNVPVRRQFQRSPTADRREIIKLITTLALGNPAISFVLISDGEKLIDVRGDGDFLDRAKEVLGGQWRDETASVECSEEGVKVQGLISRPTFTRHNRSGQYLFINGRPVFSPMISSVVAEAYGTALASKCYPLFLLDISMPAKCVDVNVHPQKKSVRLREDLPIKSALYRAVQKALGASFATEKEFIEEKPLPWEPTPVSFSPEPISFQEKVEVYAVEEPVLPMEKPIPTILGTICGYVLLEPSGLDGFSGGGVVVMDQRRAHARVLFENLEAKEHCQQPLLVPFVMEVSSPEAKLVEDRMERLQDFGFEISSMGQRSYQVSSVPKGFPEEGLSASIVALAEGEGVKLKQFVEKVAIGRAQRLSEFEAERLIRDLMDCEEWKLCPKGKPIFVQITQEELIKRFRG